MSKLLESFASDAIERVSDPAVQKVVKENILAPLMSKILEMILPYALGVVGILVAILVCVLVLVFRVK